MADFIMMAQINKSELGTMCSAKDKQLFQKITVVRVMFKGHVPTSRSWNDTSNKISKIILDYNLKYKINIHVSMDDQPILGGPAWHGS